MIAKIIRLGLCLLFLPASAWSGVLTDQADREVRAEQNFQAIMALNVAAPERQFTNRPAADTGKVRMPLAEYAEMRDRLREARKNAARSQAPLVVLGAAAYTGEARDGVLSLQLLLQVTLGAEGWKTVPLVGEEAVVTRARADEQAIGLSRRNGYHVWITPRNGEITLTLDLLIPSRGPRGSLEYDFLIAKTPITRFQCMFPMAGLEPRLRSAVRTSVSGTENSTSFSAFLQPVSRIHLVGFRDLGDESGRAARMYAESLHLLSIDEDSLDLFTVIRYHIFHAGAKQFRILIPPGMSVISADGEGAFRYALEKHDAGALLKGETAFPIRNTYEISLRLRRKPAESGKAFEILLPRSQGVEREYGWLGIEVIGNLKLEELAREEALAVDVRQLPLEVVRSAVSPILKAYRYHTSAARIRLSGIKLPEQEPASSSIDSVEAVSAVSAQGRVFTDMRITLRNRLRHALRLHLPEGMQLRSALLDKQPIRPSRHLGGALLFPLKRSAGIYKLKPFTLQVVLESQMKFPDWAGYAGLALPAAELPVSSVAWTLHLPADNLYTRLRGDIGPQTYAGSGRWYQPAEQQAQADPHAHVDRSAAGFGAAAGAMPIKINLPETAGKTLDYKRYWVEAEFPVTVSFGFLRGGLLPPMVFLLFILFSGGIVLTVEAWLAKRIVRTASLIGLLAMSAWSLMKLTGGIALFGGCLAGILALAWRRQAFRHGRRIWMKWVEAFRQKRGSMAPESWTKRRWPVRILLIAGLGLMILLLLSVLFRLLFLLSFGYWISI
ncbi:MAG: hypothetical protein GY862_10360 [Gammaproteobacteria bacterium]|nr:hypothetical protein [Gammaproteobacteria bacterium]